MKHQVKSQILDPSNFPTKKGGKKKKSRHGNRDVGGQKNQQLKALYIKEKPNHFEQLRIEN